MRLLWLYYLSVHISDLAFPKTSRTLEQFWPFDYQSTKTWDLHQLVNAGGQGKKGDTRSKTGPEAPAKSREASWVREKCPGDVPVRAGTSWEVWHSLHKAKRLPKTWMNISLSKEEGTWLAAQGCLGLSPSEWPHRLMQELCPPPCTGCWTRDSCHERGNARAEQKWITLCRRSFNSFSLQEASAFAH